MAHLLLPEGAHERYCAHTTEKSRDPAMKYAAQIAFFLLLLAVGVGVYRDYGISWDEPESRQNGVVTLKYLAEHFAPSLLKGRSIDSAPLNEYISNYYGVAFEAPSVALAEMFGIREIKDVFLFRHLLTFLIYITGIYAVERIVYRRFSDWRLSLLAALFFVLTPRLFAESFYNNKDIVLMALFAIGMNTTISFALKPGLKTAFLHAWASAIAIDVRIVAIILPAATVAILVVRLLKKELSIPLTFRVLTVYLVSVSILVLAMWPWLWADPVRHFVQAFRMFAHTPFDGPVLYMGSFVRSTELPWHHVLVYISITTPLLCLVLFLVGLSNTISKIIYRGTSLWKSKEELQDVVFLGFLAVPIATVIMLHSVLYDGWRHMYFVYPAFLLIAMRGWVALWSNDQRIRKTLLTVVTAISIVHTAIWMWRAHPYQNVYFNILAGSGDLRSRYELDYWGLANRKALEFILAKDDREVISVRADSFMPLKPALDMINIGERDRLKLSRVELSDLLSEIYPAKLLRDPQTPNREAKEKIPDYVITNYRWVQPVDDARYANEFNLFYQIRVDNQIILSVFQRKPT